MGLTPESAPIERYVVSEYLAEGGMGAIYRGQKLGAGGFAKEVVLKQLLPEYTRQPEFIDLFLREARLSATLDHANIIHTIDLVTAGDEYFIVMEYLPGADLRTLGKRIKRRRKRLAPAAAIYIAREVLSALAYAHAKLGPDGRPLGLIHRDVSPSNILVSQNGEVKLTDFGIAKASTHTSVFYKVKGKVGYMSPEQARSDDLDHRSDLYSLAVCLHELITGERLFVVAGLTSTPEEIYGQPIPPLSQKVPGLPLDLDRVMARALAVDPDQRYQSAGALQEALLRCAHRHGLMMSAPELAAHLRQLCGPPEQWRQADGATPTRSATLAAGGGTEVYDFVDDGEGTQQVDPDELARDDDEDDDLDEARLASVVAPRPREATRNERPPSTPAAERGPRAASTVALDRLQNMELTSMINLANLEQRGHQPLVDWGDSGEHDRDDRDGDEPVPEDDDGQARRSPPPAARELPPSAPHQLPPYLLPGHLPPGPMPGAYADPRAARRRWLLPAGVAVGVLALAGLAAAVIGMSGPDIAPGLPATDPVTAPAHDAGDAAAATVDATEAASP